MNTSDLIRKLCKEHNISIAELARKIGQSPQNFGKKLKRNTVSQSELNQIADTLGVVYEQTFVSDSDEDTYNALINRYMQDELGIGIGISDADTQSMGEDYIKLDSNAFTRINSLFQSLPHYAVELYAERAASDTYKVLFDKGLGQLQQSAKNSDRFRANIVAFGTNNAITGQAELEKFHLKVMTPALAVFDIAAIATNQYYLARIDQKLSSLDSKLNYVQKFLEESKKSDLWANSQFLQDVSNKIYEITQDEQYRITTLNTVQSIRIAALSNVKFYHEMMRNHVKDEFKKNLKATAVKNTLDHFYDIFTAYLYSIYVYGFAYVIEVALSQMTNEIFLCKVKEEIQSVIDNFQNDYSKELQQFIDTTKSLNQGIVGKSLSKTTPKVHSYGNSDLKLVFEAVALVANLAANYDKGKKQEKKEDVMEQFHSFQERIEKSICDLTSPVYAIERLNEIYNQPVELLITDDAAYIKLDAAKAASASYDSEAEISKTE